MARQLEELVEPVVRGLGCELWGIEQLSGARSSTLKIYIDSPSGVGVEDCARVSEQLGDLLDAEGLVRGKYTLEVSSPGLDRRLFRLEQYSAFAGCEVSVRLKTPFEGKRNFRGVLGGTEGEDVVIVRGEEALLLPFNEIDRAKVVPDYEGALGTKEPRRDQTRGGSA